MNNFIIVAVVILVISFITALIVTSKEQKLKEENVELTDKASVLFEDKEAKDDNIEEFASSDNVKSNDFDDEII